MARFQGDLPERTYRFARSIYRLVKLIPDKSENWNIARQLMKSGTSIGANVCEADAALTTPEFVQFCNVARREALETRFWLRLCRDEQVLSDAPIEQALIEVEEIGRILTTIVRKSRRSDRVYAFMRLSIYAF